MRLLKRSIYLSFLLAVIAVPSFAQHSPDGRLVTPDEILEGLTPDGSRWVTFGGDYNNHRHSPLTQITPENVHELVPQWTFQTNVLEKFETCLLYTSDAADE